MKDEIKEILDKLKDNDWYEELDLTGTKWIELKQEETNQLLDYITNLQETKTNMEQELQELYLIKDNLQEENEKLKEDNYELIKYINEEEGFVKDENRELGLRIDKAVEYNNKNIHSQTLNNILQGSDDNE